MEKGAAWIRPHELSEGFDPLVRELFLASWVAPHRHPKVPAVEAHNAHVLAELNWLAGCRHPQLACNGDESRPPLAQGVPGLAFGSHQLTLLFAGENLPAVQRVDRPPHPMEARGQRM